MAGSISGLLSQLNAIGTVGAAAAAPGGSPSAPAAPPAPPALPTAASAPPVTGGGSTSTAPTGGVDQALIGALTQLVSVLQALVQALQAQQQLTQPGPTGGGPVQSPLQSPLQVPPSKGGGPAPAAPGAPGAPGAPAAPLPAPVAGGGATTFETRPANFPGPSFGVSSSQNPGEPSSFVIRSGYQTRGAADSSLQFFGRYGSANIPKGYGQNEVSISGTAFDRGSRVALPDSGSVTLSSGATFSWSTANVSKANSNMVGGELAFSIARPGAAAQRIDRSLDTARAYDENYASPMSQAETVELAQFLARTYPPAG